MKNKKILGFLFIFTIALCPFSVEAICNSTLKSECGLCNNKIDDDCDGLIDYKDKLDCKKPDGSCVVENWIWNEEKQDYVPEPWVHPRIKEIKVKYGENSSEYNKWKNHWQVVEGCSVVKDGKKVKKPTEKPIAIKEKEEPKKENQIEKVIKKEDIRQITKIKEEKGFFERFISWMFGE